MGDETQKKMFSLIAKGNRTIAISFAGFEHALGMGQPQIDYSKSVHEKGVYILAV